MIQNDKPYFEDITVGDRDSSAARTVCEADIVNFAMLSGDWNPLHVDEEFAKQTPFGKRIAHGLLGLAISSGLQRRAPLPHIMAFLSVETHFKGPIFIGDTIRVESEVVDKKESRSKADRGVVTFRRLLKNQRDETVQETTSVLMIRRKPAEA